MSDLKTGPALVFNGVDATTGEYVHPPLSVDRMSRLAQGLPPAPKEVGELKAWLEEKRNPHLPARFDIDVRHLEQTGWGVIFAHDSDPAIHEALGELLEHRQRQAAKIEQRYYREYRGEDGYQPGEKKLAFLRRHGVAPGPADPEKMPYYLLLVGGPEEIPFHFQTQLDIQYSVGRVAFDTPEEYANYAHSVVAAETNPPARRRRVVFFGVSNPDDRTTGLSSEYLVKRVASFLEGDQPSWDIETLIGEGTTKARLGRLLSGGDDTPSLLFTACHGMGFPAGHAEQPTHQGALLCQDWPGPKQWRGAIPREHYFAADDLASDSRPAGLISFHFACHGAGTPELDAYAKRIGGTPRTLAPRPFVARLPQRLLARGALAAVGHVERSWGYAFIWRGTGSQTQIFEDTLSQLLEGYPLGAAMEAFHLRYAELAAELVAELENIDFGIGTDDPQFLPRLWTATKDARNNVIFGDPAVRLPSSSSGTPSSGVVS